MENVLNRFSVFDFFIVLASGATFLFGLELLGLHILRYFYSILFRFLSENEHAETIVLVGFVVFILFVCYMIGSVLQEVSSFHQKYWFKIKEKVMYNFLTDENVINNKVRQSILKNEAAKVFKSKGILFDIENITAVQNYYFYAYCVYYIQIRGLDKKTEKMRSLHAISNMLSLCFFVLTIIGIQKIIITYVINNNISMILLVTVIVYAILSVIFWYRMKKDIYYRTRMIAGIYEVAVENEKSTIYQTKNIDFTIEKDEDFSSKSI